MSYEDAEHRPHGIHTGEDPNNPITYGPESLSVTLDRWGPVENLFTSMYDALQANWGDAPSRTVNRGWSLYMRAYDVKCSCGGEEDGLHGKSCHKRNAWEDRQRSTDAMDVRTGWVKLDTHEQDYIESCFAGKTLQQVLEGITFDFCIDGVSRAFTHQNVRTRLGAGFMQHGGRDNDWRHRAWTMPETIRRMCEAFEGIQAYGIPGLPSNPKLKHCITDWKPIVKYLEPLQNPDADELDIEEAIEEHIMNGRRLYSALVDAGIPWQDARRVLFMGMQTYIHDQYNYLALQGVLANRLEHVMDWEFNCVAQLMLREIKMKCPPLFSKYLGSHSDKARQAKFAGLESWPPDRKYPSPYDDCELCGHAGSNHRDIDLTTHNDKDPVVEQVCAICERGGSKVGPMHKFKPVDRLQRQHRPEQMPFFVLHPDSMAGGPVVWIPTNGQYPHDKVK